MELDERKKLIGKRIKEMRKKADLNQTQLASELSNGVKTDRGKSTISEYEHGKNLNLDNIHRIAEVINNYVPCDENYLLGCQEHPDITTSWIAEQIPLRIDAIEALQHMRYKLDEWSDSESQFFGFYILSDLIIHFAQALDYDASYVIDPINHDDLLGNIIDMQFAYEAIAENESWNGTPFEMDKDYRKELLTIRGASAWIAGDVAETVRKAIKEYADPKHLIDKEV